MEIPRVSIHQLQENKWFVYSQPITGSEEDIEKAIVITNETGSPGPSALVGIRRRGLFPASLWRRCTLCKSARPVGRIPRQWPRTCPGENF